MKLGLQYQTNRDAMIYRSSISTWLTKCGQLGCPGRSKLRRINSKIQVESRMWESILVVGGEISLERTSKVGSKFGNFLL